MKMSELKILINEAVRDTLAQANKEQNIISMSGSYRWKEAVMKAVQDALYARGDMIDSQEQLEGAIDEEIERTREDIDLTLSMIGKALYQVPYQAFKNNKN